MTLIHNGTSTSIAAAEHTQSGAAVARQRILEAGITVGRWTLLLSAELHGRPAWNCRCACGTIRVVDARSLSSGASRSCGCFMREVSSINGKRNAVHGWKGSKTYRVWSRMKERCSRPGHKSWSDYGGRGISVCERWRQFENFLADMGPVPERMTLERKDVNGNYEPGNCKWATMQEQARNKRSNHILTVFGESKTVVEWSEDARCEANLTALQKRLGSGWSDIRAVTEPMKPDSRRTASGRAAKVLTVLA